MVELKVHFISFKKIYHVEFWNVFLSIYLFYFMYECFVCLSACLYVHYIPAWWPPKPEEGAESSGVGVIDSCESPNRFWEPNLEPLQKQQVLVATEPFL